MTDITTKEFALTRWDLFKIWAWRDVLRRWAAFRGAPSIFREIFMAAYFPVFLIRIPIWWIKLMSKANNHWYARKHYVIQGDTLISYNAQGTSGKVDLKSVKWFSKFLGYYFLSCGQGKTIIVPFRAFNSERDEMLFKSRVCASYDLKGNPQHA